VLWFGVYLLTFLLSSLAGGEHAAEAFSEFIVVFQGILVLMAAGNLMQTQRVATRSMSTLVLACSVRASLPFVGFAKTSSAVWTGGERVSALGQNANSAAMILAAGMVALIGLAFAQQRQGLTRIILAATLGTLIGFAVLETGSRGGLVSLLGGMLVFGLAADSMQVRIRNGLIGTIAITLLIVGTLHLPMMKNRLEDSMRTGNMAGREQLYPALWAMFLEKPVLGWGPVTNTFELAARIGERERPARAAHNIVLELLTATGVVGAIPFLMGAWLCVRDAWRARRGPHAVLPLALCCSVFLSNMSGDWIASKLIWLVLAYAYASVRAAAPALELAPARLSTPLPAVSTGGGY
jgi:O-antigen ligase